MQMIAKERRAFTDPLRTAAGERRASVTPEALTTLWLNTGTLCNLTCKNCYIESSPSNDALVYLNRAEVQEYLREVAQEKMPVREIGITGGEPFMNPDILEILEDCLKGGYQVLVLTNAMRPMMKQQAGLLALRQRYSSQLRMRVSIDHFERQMHEEERGRRSWQPTLDGLSWLARSGFTLSVAGRTRWGESEADLREGYRRLFQSLDIGLNALDPESLILFPEMDATAEVPEITTACWGILGVNPADMMCASARMVVKRRGQNKPEVVACTLLPYESGFSLGHTLAASMRPVALNHPHCARFCVLGGGSCSA